MKNLGMNVKREHLSMIEELEDHTIDMSLWGGINDCGTVGCLWGSMYMAANGNELAQKGPCYEWTQQSPWHRAMSVLFGMTCLSAETALMLAKKMDSAGHIDLGGLDLTEYSFYGIRERLSINFKGANVREFNVKYIKNAGYVLDLQANCNTIRTPAVV